MLKRLQHLGSLRLECALWRVVAHGVFVCAVSSRRLVVRGGILACGYACAESAHPIRRRSVEITDPRERPYGLQEIVKPFNIPEQNSAGKGENSNFLLLAIPLLHSLGS